MIPWRKEQSEGIADRSMTHVNSERNWFALQSAHSGTYSRIKSRRAIQMESATRRGALPQKDIFPSFTEKFLSLIKHAINQSTFKHERETCYGYALQVARKHVKQPYLRKIATFKVQATRQHLNERRKSTHLQ